MIYNRLYPISHQKMQHLLVSRALSPIFLAKPQSLPMAHLPTSAVATTAAVPGSKARLRGVVFDMDGTLTVPAIDFAAMYRAVLGDDEYHRIKAENPSGIDILHHIESWSPSKQQRAYEVIADYERQGIDRLQIMPGAAELCGFLDANKMRLYKFRGNLIWPFHLSTQAKTVGICFVPLFESFRRGLITRNVKDAVDIFHSRFGVIFSPALSREFRPYKPDPAPLLHICSAWDVKPNEVMMVGDSLKDDVACGKRAGAYTCLLDETGRYDSPEYSNVEYKPDFKVSSLSELHSLMKANFNLLP